MGDSEHDFENQKSPNDTSGQRRIHGIVIDGASISCQRRLIAVTALRVIRQQFVADQSTV